MLIDGPSLCEQNTLFSIQNRIKSSIEWVYGMCCKLGERPPYGQPTPPRLIKLIGPDRDIFLKGRNCEN